MNKQLAIVLELERQLNELGYQPWQLEMIIQDAIGSDILDENSQEQLERVIEVLNCYIGFAAEFRNKN
jgi:hypothetical protein